MRNNGRSGSGSALSRRLARYSSAGWSSWPAVFFGVGDWANSRSNSRQAWRRARSRSGLCGAVITTRLPVDELKTVIVIEPLPRLSCRGRERAGPPLSSPIEDDQACRLRHVLDGRIMHRNGRGRCTSDGLCRWIERKPRTPPRPLVRVRLIAASTHLSFLVRILPAHSITSSTRISTTAGGGAGGLVQCGRASRLPLQFQINNCSQHRPGVWGVNWARTLARCGPQKSCPLCPYCGPSRWCSTTEQPELLRAADDARRPSIRA
jgi:hypothetical protein